MQENKIGKSRSGYGILNENQKSGNGNQKNWNCK